MALQKLVKDMNQAIVVVDDRNRIMDCNPAFAGIFPEWARNKRIRSLTDILLTTKQRSHADFDEAQMLSAFESESASKSPFEMNRSVEANPSVEANYPAGTDSPAPDLLYYSVEIQPIAAKDRAVLGKVATFRDVTEYKNLLTEVRQQYDELADVV